MVACIWLLYNATLQKICADDVIGRDLENKLDVDPVCRARVLWINSLWLTQRLKL